jgi:hypothetical protein
MERTIWRAETRTVRGTGPDGPRPGHRSGSSNAYIQIAKKNIQKIVWASDFDVFYMGFQAKPADVAELLKRTEYHLFCLYLICLLSRIATH